MAQNDTFEWNQAIAAALPSGQGIVCRDSSPDDGANNASQAAAACDGLGTNFAIKIWWLEDRSEANTAGTLKRVVTAFKP
jgi:type IV pilus assembly protein PilV